jgi:hypothetical protein
MTRPFQNPKARVDIITTRGGGGIEVSALLQTQIRHSLNLRISNDYFKKSMEISLIEEKKENNNYHYYSPFAR